MAFRASNAIPEQVYAQLKNEVNQIKILAESASGQLDVNISADSVVGFLSGIARRRARLGVLAGTAGLAAYAQVQEDDPAYDVVAEYTAMVATLDAAIATIQATPTNALITGWNASGVDWATFTPAQTLGLKADFDAIVAAIA